MKERGFLTSHPVTVTAEHGRLVIQAEIGV
ncbi:hypothetical protein [Edaphovirga cremea]